MTAADRGETTASEPDGGERTAPDRGERTAPDRGEEFAAHRNLLFTVAYEITGSVVDAEDVVQESWLRWSAGDRSEVRNTRAYLARIATRLALNSVRSRERRRETYVGSWLPEPLLTGPDVAQDAVLAESVSMGMLVLLQALSPDERAVFVLREVFGFEHAEIALFLGRTDASVRQVAHRARNAVQARRPRFDADREQVQAVLQRFWAALGSGDVQALLGVLSPDVVVISDGGGLLQAPLRPVEGADKVSRLLFGLVRRTEGVGTTESAELNALPAAVLRRLDGTVDSVGLFEVTDGRVRRIYLVRNPEKLAELREVPLDR
jgi:RNA polymerase sigma-70 factor (TIGR02957 family)